VVVAAAGNFSTDRPFYPAALAARPPGPGAPLLSVGALNPNGSVALFSNQGDWVHWWAPGAAVVSTFPPLSGSISPAIRPPHGGGAHRRETLDPDDFQGGFAIWSGTSFAAPVVAAEVAAALLAGHHPGAPLTDLNEAAAVARAKAAVARVAADRKDQP
jgi:subtilisin family serine protease